MPGNQSTQSYSCQNACLHIFIQEESGLLHPDDSCLRPSSLPIARTLDCFFFSHLWPFFCGLSHLPGSQRTLLPFLYLNHVSGSGQTFLSGAPDLHLLISVLTIEILTFSRPNITTTCSGWKTRLPEEFSTATEGGRFCFGDK